MFIIDEINDIANDIANDISNFLYDKCYPIYFFSCFLFIIVGLLLLIDLPFKFIKTLVKVYKR